MSVKLFSESQQGMDLCSPVLNGFHPGFFFFFFLHMLLSQLKTADGSLAFFLFLFLFFFFFFFITSICKQLNSVLGR